MPSVSGYVRYSGGYAFDGYVEKSCAGGECSYDDVSDGIVAYDVIGVSDDGGGNTITDRAYAEFEISGLPAGATITQVKLTLQVGASTSERYSYITAMDYPKTGYASDEAMFGFIGVGTVLWTGYIHTGDWQEIEIDLGSAGVSDLASHTGWMMLGFMIDETSPPATLDSVNIYDADIVADKYLEITYSTGVSRRRHSICHM